MRRKVLFGFAGLLIAIAAFTLGFELRHDGTADQSQSVLPETKSPQPSVNSHGVTPTEPLAPPISGHKYHALDLLRMRPFPDQDRLVLLNVVSQPNAVYGDVVDYITLRRGIPEEANARGVRFKGMFGPRLCIYDVIEALPGDGVMEQTAVRQIAVELSPGVSPPGNENNWNVEPDGFQEVTASDGTVLHLPKIRFWSYE